MVVLENETNPTLRGNSMKGSSQKQVSTNYHSTSVNSSDVPITPEKRSLDLLRRSGFQYIQQIDWLCKSPNGRWVAIEVKDKDLFIPGSNFPHYGTGLELRQLYLRRQIREELGIPAYLLELSKSPDTVYFASLNDLEKQGVYYDCLKEKTRIYPLEHFVKFDSNGILELTESGVK